MSDTQDTQDTQDQTEVTVNLEIFPQNGTTISIRQIAAGHGEFVHISINPEEEPGALGLLLSCLTPEEALELLSFAQLSLHNYLGQEGR